MEKLTIAGDEKKGIMHNEGAQVSMEMLIIVAIAIVVATVIGLYLKNMAKVQTAVVK